MNRPADRGAAAVEFALVLPLLVVLVFGITEFGRAYNVITQLSNAAREGVRVMALQNSSSAARTAAKNAAPSLGLTDAQISVTPGSCATTTTAPAATATVSISYPFTFAVASLFGGPITLHGQGVMRCTG